MMRAMRPERAVFISILLVSAACGDDSAAMDGGTDGGGAVDAPTPDSGPPDGGTPPRPVEVTISDGVVRGLADDATGVTTFRGIPYAAPPVGDLRWRPPAPPAPWSAPLDATATGPACPQQDTRLVDRAQGLDEDCLRLNVWKPNDAAEPLPVIVFIHGGAFLTGSSNYGVYNGTSIASHGAVVVSMNYRLGLLGFMAHPAFATEDADWPTTGNYGLLDQIAALEWVRDEIAAFGGDPSRVAILGESAGGMSVCTLIAAPRAAGLFQSAIIESASCLSRYQIHDAALATSEAETYAEGLGCGSGIADPAACLRGKPWEDVLAAETGTLVNFDALERPGPSVDGLLLDATPAERVANGDASYVPLIMGFNANEGSILVQGAGVDTEADLDTTLEQLGGGTVSSTDLRALYDPADYGDDPRAAAIAAVTDIVFRCPTRRSLRDYVANGGQAWAYYFTHVAPIGRLTGLGAFHGSELFILFQDGALDAGDLAVSERMIAHDIALVTHGAAGMHDGLAWPAFDAATESYLEMDEPAATGMGWPGGARCDELDALFGGL